MGRTCEYGSTLYNADYVAAVLQDEMEARGLTQKQMAEACGVGIQSIKRITHGEMPSLPLILVICEVLNLTPDYLLGYMEDPEYIGKLHHGNATGAGTDVQEVGHVDS